MQFLRAGLYWKCAGKPILAVALIGATYPHWLLFRIKNAGRGPALRCVFICKDNDMLDWKVKEKVLPIGAGETLELKLEHELGGSWRPGERIFLDVKYSDIFGKIYEGRLLEIDTNAVMQGFGVA